MYLEMLLTYLERPLVSNFQDTVLVITVPADRMGKQHLVLGHQQGQRWLQS